MVKLKRSVISTVTAYKATATIQVDQIDFSLSAPCLLSAVGLKSVIRVTVLAAP
jgi:hypothetical protein